MTPEELKALEAIKAAEAAGQDPFGDDEPLGQDPQAEDQAADDMTPDAAEPVAEEPAEEAADEPQASAEEPMATPEIQAPQSFKAEMPADYKAQRAELLAQRATAMKELMEGELEPDAFAAKEAQISDALEELTASRIRAETLHEANIQSQQRYQQQSIQRLIAKTKDQVDYAASEEARGQFDTALQVVAAQPANRGKDFADLIEDAHKVVSAMRGVMAKQVTPPAPRKPDGTPPVTLRSLPSASTPNTGSVVDQIARLKGPAYEAAFDKLTPAQKAALLDAD